MDQCSVTSFLALSTPGSHLQLEAARCFDIASKFPPNRHYPRSRIASELKSTGCIARHKMAAEIRATGMRWIIHVATRGASKWLMSLRKTFKSSHTLRCVFSLSSRCQLLIPSSRLPSFHLHYRKQTHKYYRHASHNTADNASTHPHTTHKQRILRWWTPKLEGENWGRTSRQTKDS